MKISVILPTFNRANFIKKAIDSVLVQDWEQGNNIELIIVDDFSTDNTEQIVSQYNDTRIKYIKNPKNMGGAKSRNIGVANSTGEYLSFIDSDVVWYKNKLSIQLEKLLESKTNDIVYCLFRKQKGNKWIVLPNNIKDGHIFNELLADNIVDTPSVILKKDIFLNVGGFDESLPRFQDWDLFIRLSKKYNFSIIKEILYDSYTLINSISSNDEARLKALTTIFDKYKLEISNNKKIYHRYILKIINANLILNKTKNAKIFLDSHKISLDKRYLYKIIIQLCSILPKNTYKNIFKFK